MGWAVFYGFIQGVAEFLPISSSGHLALIPFVFDLKDPGVVFDLTLHLGTAIAVILYFHKDVKELICEGLLLLKNRNIKECSFLVNFISATFFSFLLILVIKGIAFKYGRNPIFIGVNLIVFGVLMWIADLKKSKGIDLTKDLDLKRSALIGISQSLAVFPGVSRSGATLTSSRMLGLGRVEASRFSFLLSLPVILGSIVFKLPELIAGDATSASGSLMAGGIFFSFLFGIVTIHFFLKLIAKAGLVYFTIYRVIIGAILLYFSL